MRDVDVPITRIPANPDVFRLAYEDHDHLYDLQTDPGQEENLAGGPREAEYEALLRKAMQEIGAPEEQFFRLGL
jgi:hypothetical protein